jgi:hypothetical protein
MHQLEETGAIHRQLAARARKSPSRLVLSAPLFSVGYILLLIGAARLVAASLGWSANLLLVGLGILHVALGIIVVTIGMEPAIADAPLPAAGMREMAPERADTLITQPRHTSVAVLQPPAFPPRTRLSS